LRQEHEQLDEVTIELRRNIDSLENEKVLFIQEIDLCKTKLEQELKKHQDYDGLTTEAKELKEKLEKQVFTNTNLEEENTKNFCQIEELMGKIDALDEEKSLYETECEKLKNRLNVEEGRHKDYDKITMKANELEHTLANKELASSQQIESLENELRNRDVCLDTINKESSRNLAKARNLEERLDQETLANSQSKEVHDQLNGVIEELRHNQDILKKENSAYSREIELGKTKIMQEQERYEDYESLVLEANELKEKLKKQTTISSKMEEENTNNFCQIEELMKRADTLEKVIGIFLFHF
jgi:chromosome segregation ATPase